MIRQARAEDLEAIIALVRSCGVHMKSKGIFQWNDYYPSLSAFKKDLEREELYVLENHLVIQGCIVISAFKDEVYNTVRWISNTENNIYIHRLAIDPKSQGQGCAKKLMDYAEDYSRAHNFESIRLDTFSQNPRNLRFYELRGYQRLEEVFFPKQSEFPFYCYELLL